MRRGAALLSELVDQRISRPLDLFKVGFDKVVSVPVLTMSRGVESTTDADVSIHASDDDNAVDLRSHEVEVTPQTVDLNRPTRFVRSAPRPGMSILPQRPNDDALSAREVLERLATQPKMRLASDTASTPVPPVQVTTPVGRPALTPRFLDAANAILERLLFTPVSTGRMPMPRTIAVVSSTPGQGATTVAAHLAAALSDYQPNGNTDASNKVLLVDANLVAPAVHRIMDVAPAPGLAEWVLDPHFAEQPTEAISRHTALPKLDVLTAGVVTQGHQPGRWADAVMAAAHSKYHLVVVDLPAMSRCESAARVAGMCDAVIVVVECDHGNREVLREAALRLSESGANVLGVVLNKRTFPIPEGLYRRL
ncbi:MAG: CpsD/CapB family tyrosine-protein kinase [Tepidisphaeraceae bacterium]